MNAPPLPKISCSFSIVNAGVIRSGTRPAVELQDAPQTAAASPCEEEEAQSKFPLPLAFGSR